MFANLGHQKGKWATFLIASLLMLTAGTLYGFGAYSTDLASEMNRSSVELAGSFGDFGVYASILVGIFYDYYGPNITAFFAGILTFVGYFVPWLMLKGYMNVQFPVLCVFFFFLGQGSVGFYYVSLQTTCQNFDAKHRGKIMGYCHMLYALSSMLFTLIYSSVLSYNLNQYFLILALTLGIMGAVSAFTVTRYEIDPMVKDLDQHYHTIGEYSVTVANDSDEDFELGRNVASDSEVDKKTVIAESPVKQKPEAGQVLLTDAHPLLPTRTVLDITGLELAKRLDFWILFFIMFFTTGSGLMWKNLVGSICDSYNIDGATVDMLIITWSLTSTVTRIVVGSLSDIFRLTYPRPVFFIIGTCVMLISHFAYIFAHEDVLWLVTIGTGIGYGTVWAINPTIVSLYYGMPHLSINLALMGFASAFSGLLLTGIATPLDQENYTYMFVLSSIGLVIAICLSVYLASQYDVQILEQYNHHIPTKKTSFKMRIKPRLSISKEETSTKSPVLSSSSSSSSSEGVTQSDGYKAYFETNGKQKG